MSESNSPRSDDTLPPAMKIIKKDHLSKRMRYLQAVIRPFRPSLVKPTRSHKSGEPSPKLKQPHQHLVGKCFVGQCKISGMWQYKFAPKIVRTTGGFKRTRIYYFAGGGWQMPPSSQHWKFCVELSRNLPEANVILISYPLAPLSPASETFPKLSEWYETIMDDANLAGEPVIFIGDSSGANILLSLTLYQVMHDPSMPHPKALMAISPAVDLEQKKREGVLEEVEKHDPIMNIDYINRTASIYSGDTNAATVWISPINADMNVLAKNEIKVYGVTGGYDVLTPDALVFRDRCIDAGVAGEWLEWDKQMHCFPLAWIYGLPESKEAKNWIIEMLKRPL